MEAGFTLFLWAQLVWVRACCWCCLHSTWLCVRRSVSCLFRKKKKGFSMLYMDGENEQYWRMDRAEIEDLDVSFGSTACHVCPLPNEGRRLLCSGNASSRFGPTSFYEVLWSKGRMLGDDRLMGIAFEN
ncbi:hypothetical protein Plhal304r1_c080g0166371 [Plasmopara halstedii]